MTIIDRGLASQKSTSYRNARFAAQLVAVAGGGAHSLALKTDGTVAGWGNDYYGQRSAPSGLSNVTIEDNAITNTGTNNYLINVGGTNIMIQNNDLSGRDASTPGDGCDAACSFEPGPIQPAGRCSASPAPASAPGGLLVLLALLGLMLSRRR